jgi:hypothetical protein
MQYAIDRDAKLCCSMLNLAKDRSPFHCACGCGAELRHTGSEFVAVEASGATCNSDFRFHRTSVGARAIETFCRQIYVTCFRCSLCGASDMPEHRSSFFSGQGDVPKSRSSFFSCQSITVAKKSDRDGAFGCVVRNANGSVFPMSLLPMGSFRHHTTSADPRAPKQIWLSVEAIITAIPQLLAGSDLAIESSFLKTNECLACVQTKQHNHMVDTVKSWPLLETQNPTPEMVAQIFPDNPKATAFLTQMHGVAGVLQAIKYMPI